MLIQMPRGPSDSPGTQNAEECNAFEAALRRDLASAPVISYESVLGGLLKRVLEVAITLLTAPLWLTMMLGAALWSKARHPARVFQAQELIGYGGRSFRCFSLRLEPPSAVIERLHGEQPEPAAGWDDIARNAEDGRAKWRHVLERLPQMINLLRGEMALVGPRPLSRDDLEPLRIAKRYYLSARPGVIGVEAIADLCDEPSAQYKGYALSWSLTTDALILWDGLRSLRNRGELWRPGRIRRLVVSNGELPIAVRRRGGAAE